MGEFTYNIGSRGQGEGGLEIQTEGEGENWPKSCTLQFELSAIILIDRIVWCPTLNHSTSSGVVKGPTDPLCGGGGAPNRCLNMGQFQKNLTKVVEKLTFCSRNTLFKRFY